MAKKKTTKKAAKQPKDKDYGEVKAKDRAYDQEKYMSYAKGSHRTLYWLILLVLVVFNFLIFIALAFLAVFLDAFQRTAVIAGIGLVFGLIFNFLIIDLEHLEQKHHLVAALIIPIVAVVNLLIMTWIINGIRNIWDMPLAGSTITESIIYVGFFIAPYLYSLLKGQITYR